MLSLNSAETAFANNTSGGNSREPVFRLFHPLPGIRREGSRLS
jgi:hypothetical protein